MSIAPCQCSLLVSPPVAAAVDCGPLRDIAGGHVFFVSTLLSAVANYSCKPGYTLIGTPHRICQANSQWSGEEPSCAGYLTIIVADNYSLMPLGQTERPTS